MVCRLQYIDNQSFSESEKERLTDIHLNLFKEAKESNSFRSYNGKFYTLKNDYGKGVRFVNGVNSEYNNQIASLGRDTTGYFLKINTLPLSNEKQEEIYFSLSPNVDYTLKSINILQSHKADEIFRKGDKNNWSIDKILQELQIPKEQQELIKSFNTRNREEILTSLLASYSYTVKINTAIDFDFEQHRLDELDTFNYGQFSDDELAEMRVKKKEPKGLENTQYYSNLTVPGGTNYTENEISTPAITPSIKGHAQFSTKNGIGWFRSDDKTNKKLPENYKLDPDINGGYTKDGQPISKKEFNLAQGGASKTRRILEVQSDLFQKGRENKDLIGNQEGYYEEGVGQMQELDQRPTNKQQNQFLQLLNKDNNWVTFFIKSIIQDSAKKGYEKVLFPSGNTASKVEGHSTLEDFKSQIEDRIKDLEDRISKTNQIKEVGLTPSGYYSYKLNTGLFSRYEYITKEEADEGLEKYKKDQKIEAEHEINQLNKELERVEKEGFAALRPIYKFYEETVGNIVKKLGKIEVFKDEYGNTWNEFKIDKDRDLSKIYLQQPKRSVGNINIIKSKNLRTFDFGSLEGQPQTEAKNKAIHNNIINIPDELMSDEGETFDQAFRRIIPEMQNIIKNSPNNTLVVTHNSVFGVIKLWDEEGRPSEFTKEQRIKYTEQDNKFKTGAHFTIKGDNGDIIILRHGQTKDNIAGVFRTKNTELTEEGIKQAKQVGKELSNIPISQVIASPLSRTLHTANLILAEQKVKNPLTSSIASTKTISLIKDFIKRIGVDLQTLQNIYVNGVKQDANGAAFIMQNLIQVVNGKESEALTEEAMHFAVEIIEQKDPKLFNRLIKEINNYKLYKDVLADYSKDTNYQTKEGKPDIRKLKKEAIGKVLSETIISKADGLNESPELIANVQSWWKDIIDFLRNLFTKSGFDIAAMKILNGEEIGTVEDIRNKQNQIYLQNELHDFGNRNNGLSIKEESIPGNFKLLFSRKIDSNSLGFTTNSKNDIGTFLHSALYEKFKGRTFREISQLGYNLEGSEIQIYSIIRSLQSLFENPFNKSLAEKLKLGSIGFISDANRPSASITNNRELLINLDPKRGIFNHIISFSNNLDESALLDTIISEELIHLVSSSLSTNQETEDAFKELTKEDKLNILQTYFHDANLTNLSLLDKYQYVHEYVRMQIQKKKLGYTTEEKRTSLSKIINKVWDYLKGLLDKYTFISSIYDKTLNFIDNGGEINQNNNSSILGTPNINDQSVIYNKLKDINSQLEKKNEEYYINGKKINKRVTKFVKDWYSNRFKGNELTKSEYAKGIDDLKAEKGTKGHEDIEHAFQLFVDENGYLRDTPLEDNNYISQINPENNDIYNLLKNNLQERLKSFPEGTRFLSEISVFDAKRDLAGTIDFLAIEPDGKIDVLDWKFMDLNTNKYEDIPWYKVGAWRQQMGQYKLILERVYGVKSQDFNQTRMIPIKAKYSEGNRKQNILPSLLGIEIGDVEVKNIKDSYLIPVGLEEEKTGNEEIDVLISKLNSLYRKISDKKSLPDQKTSKAEQLNSLFVAIRQLQMKQNIHPLLQQAKVLNKQIQEIINNYETNWSGKNPKDFTDSQIDNFYEEMEVGENALEFYTSLDTDLSFLLQDGKDKELKEELRNTSDSARYSSKKLNSTGEKFINEFIAGKEGVENILSPEKAIKGISRWFSSTSNLQLKSLETLYKKVNRIFAYASMDTLSETKKLQQIKKAYDKWANLKGYTKKGYFSIIKKKDKNELIDEFNPEFYKELKSKLIDKDLKWVRENIDVPLYKEAIQKDLEQEIERIKNKPRIGTEEEIDNQIGLEVGKARILYDLSTPTSFGWYLEKLLRKFPNREMWETKEWKELHKEENKPALDFYNYIKERNEFYRDIGYILGKEARVFLPFIRKGLLEKLSTGGSWDLGERFLRSIYVDEGDIGYGQIDPLTGRPIDTIPIYFTKEINGDLSEDLFRNMALYNEMAIRYQYLNTIESQARALVNLERNKRAILTSLFGKIVYKDGKIQYTPDNSENSKLIEDMVKAIVYGQKYIQSETFDQLLGSLGDFGERANKKLGIRLFPENLNGRQVSVNKIITNLNNTFQLNTLGLNPLSALSNLLGGSFQSTINAGTYFTKSDFMASELWLSAGKMTGGEDQKKMIAALEYFLPLTDNYNKEIAKTLSINSLSQENIQEFLMILMRKSDWFVQTANFYSFLKNSIVDDGKVVNVREFLRNQEEFQDMYSGTSSQRKERKGKFENEVKKLLDEKGVLKLSSVDKNGTLTIPGVERKSDSVVELRRKVQQLNKDALGNLSEDDLRNINLNIIGKSFMLFKNWIPRLVDVRTGNLKYNSASDAYEWGRLRMVFRIISENVWKSLGNLSNSLKANDKGVYFMRQLYEKKKSDYETDTGKTLEMTPSQFNDLVRKNIKAQLADAIFMLTLLSIYLSLKYNAPDDDEDEHVKNGYKFMLRATDKIKDELAYFYNPANLTTLVSSGIFPSLAYIENFKTLLSRFMIENYAIIAGNEALEDKNYVIKYLMKSFPVTNQINGLLPMFYPQVAHDLGIKPTTQARPLAF